MCHTGLSSAPREVRAGNEDRNLEDGIEAEPWKRLLSALNTAYCLRKE